MTLEDNEAIRTVFAKYCLSVDAGDADVWVGLFADDGVFDLGMGGPPVAGREALEQFSARMAPGRGMHLSANPVIEVDGDEAKAESYVFVVGVDGEPRIRLAGRYQDTLRRIDGRWRFAERRLEPMLRLPG